MANLTRTAKRTTLWSTNELNAFNIQVVDTDLETFFGNAVLPSPNSFSRAVVDNLTQPLGNDFSIDERQFFYHLRSALHKGRAIEILPYSNFVISLLRLLKYESYNHVLDRKSELKLEMCNKRVTASMDVCFIDSRDPKDSTYLLFVQIRRGNKNPEAQLVGNAIAAFQVFNQSQKADGLPEVASHMYPGISFTGTAPTFYKITVTDQLSESVASGQYPAQVTFVERFVPPVPDPTTFTEAAMYPLDNRYIIMQCFDAFKKFLGPICKDFPVHLIERAERERAQRGS